LIKYRDLWWEKGRTVLLAKYVIPQGITLWQLYKYHRITARKGLQVDLPQPLAGAELGWAVDERRLFIGNGPLEDGAPVVGNTEISH
jgi:hypothetical protein